MLLEATSNYAHVKFPDGREDCSFSVFPSGTLSKEDSKVEGVPDVPSEAIDELDTQAPGAEEDASQLSVMCVPS